MENNKFGQFPKNKYEALAMLYMQSQDLSGMSPERLFDAYENAYKRICNRGQLNGSVEE